MVHYYISRLIRYSNCLDIWHIEVLQTFGKTETSEPILVSVVISFRFSRWFFSAGPSCWATNRWSIWHSLLHNRRDDRNILSVHASVVQRPFFLKWFIGKKNGVHKKKIMSTVNLWEIQTIQKKWDAHPNWPPEAVDELWRKPPSYEQHQDFLSTDQPALQFSKPAPQSYLALAESVSPVLV